MVRYPHLLTVSVSDDMLEAIKRVQQHFGETRPDALRRLVMLGLERLSPTVNKQNPLFDGDQHA